MQAYFCVVQTGLKKLEWFVSRDPGYTLSSMRDLGKRASLLFYKEAEDSAAAFQVAEEFTRMKPAQRWKSIREANSDLHPLEPPKVLVVAGGMGGYTFDPVGMISDALHEANLPGDIDNVRKLMSLLSQKQGFDDQEPNGGVRARLPFYPPSRPVGNAEPPPTQFRELAVKNGINFSQLMSV
ncbi:MAG: hypothetical protein ABUL72_04610 [Armatimonadota bacterium]